MFQDVPGKTRTQKPNDSRGFVHKRILGAATGFLGGGIGGAVSGFARGGRVTRPITTLPVLQIPGGGSTRTKFRLGPFGPSFERLTSRFTIPAGTGTAVGELIGVGVDRLSRGPVQPTADGCPKGFHLNKSAYSLKDGSRVEERTLCVRNRRRNNDNGKAALRAARRLVGRKKHQETIDKALRAIAPSRRRSSSKKQPAAAQTIVSTAG